MIHTGFLPPPTPVTSSGAACSVGFSVSTSWQGADGTYVVLNLYLSAIGPEDIPVPYSITISNPTLLDVSSVWNFQVRSMMYNMSRTLLTSIMFHCYNAVIKCMNAKIAKCQGAINISYEQVTTMSTGVVSGTLSDSWEGLLADNTNVINIGGIFVLSGTADEGPTSVAINGVPCTLGSA